MDEIENGDEIGKVVFPHRPVPRQSIAHESPRRGLAEATLTSLALRLSPKHIGLAPAPGCESVRRHTRPRPTRAHSREPGPVQEPPLHHATPPVPCPLGASRAARCSGRL